MKKTLNLSKKRVHYPSLRKIIDSSGGICDVIVPRRVGTYQIYCDLFRVKLVGGDLKTHVDARVTKDPRWISTLGF